MDYSANPSEQQFRFLDAMATQFNFGSDTLTVFLNRFDKANRNQDNFSLAIKVVWNRIPEDKTQKFQDELTKICQVLEENGCSIEKSKRGRQPKGKSPWEQAYKWLWNTKFIEWQQSQKELAQPINWQAVSQAMLEEQLRLTTNPLTSCEGISYRTEQVYVPLGLVERKRQTRRREDVPPEQGSLLYEETEITQRFEHEQFLEQVLQQGQSPKSRGKRIAIIGEPGVGKTTLLQQIAKWVGKQGEGAIAIWVSLADLRGQELEPYLLGRWLQAVAWNLGQAEASSQVKDAFVAQFQQGRVWLLLDGVDEMQVSSGNPLSEISRQVRMGGLLSQARIVLTCRLNLWDGNRNGLDTFDTYRTLEFYYPHQVEQFVRQLFGALSGGQVEQAERLCAVLKAPGKERIRDLVKNPLRLTLLCFNWYLGEGTLPETKAGLYEQFVADFYEWKPEPFSTTAKQRRQLNAALGELAREAIDKEETRFRLRHDFVCEFLGEPDEEGSLFWLTLQLGWLNKVGMDAENRKKAVYAFFHPTFQEYFAALVIDDWHYFLNHIPENPGHPDARYRIFEPQWKEVILLWFGLSDVGNQKKEDFRRKIIEFKDEYGEWESFAKVDKGFYEYQAYFLAAASIAELYNESCANEVIKSLIKWSFGYCNQQEGEWITFFEPIAEDARKTLIEISSSKVVGDLVNLLEDYDIKWEVKIEVIQTLEKIGIYNDEVIKAIVNLIEDARSKLTCNPSNSTWEDRYGIQQVIDLTNESILMLSAKSLAKIDINPSRGINYLQELITYSKTERTQILAAGDLAEIQPNNKFALDTLKKLITYSGILTKKQAFIGILKIDKDFIVTNKNLFGKISSVKEVLGFEIAIDVLELLSENQSAIDVLIDIIQNSLDEYLRWEAAIYLGKLVRKQPNIVNKLIKLNQQYHSKKLGNIQSNYLCIVYINNNKEEISTYITLLKPLLYDAENKGDKTTTFQITYILSEIEEGKEIAIYALLRSIKKFPSYWKAEEAVTRLKDICIGIDINKILIFLNEEILKKFQNSNEEKFQYCYELLWHCSRNMDYLDFYHACNPEKAEKITIGNSSLTQKLNFSQFFSKINLAFANEPILNAKVQLVCIDININFNDLDMLAADIYAQMVKQGCPECPQDRPTTFPKLSIYWKLNLENLEKPVALLFYNSENVNQFRKDCLAPLSTFGGAIAIITDQPCENVETISPNHPDIIDAVLKWLRRRILEA